MQPHHSPWTERDDRYLLSNQRRLTNRMIAQDLGRSYSAIENRLTVLRRQMAGGGCIARMPNSQFERDAVRDGVLHLLAEAVARRELTADAARLCVDRLRGYLLLPDRAFARYRNWTLAQWAQAVRHE